MVVFVRGKQVTFGYSLGEIDCFLVDNGLIVTGLLCSFIVVLNGLTFIYQAMSEDFISLLLLLQ